MIYGASSPKKPGLERIAHRQMMLERIAHSQMQALVLLEAWNVVESVLTRIVWQMQTDSPIYSNHKHSHIVADTHSGAYSQLLVELIKLEGLERGQISILHPDITGIQEQSTIKIAPDLRTVFQIRLELDISRTKDVGILVTQGTVVLLAWSDTSHTEGTVPLG